MTRYFLGADIGSSKSHASVADETGTILGFGHAGAGNHESVGFDGMIRALTDSAHGALANAGIAKSQIAAAGFGISGFDWQTERPAMLEAIGTLGLDAPLDIVNDATCGLIAGSEEGWGIGIVSGTGCNCRGRTRDRKREGMVTGAGQFMGEGGGAGELVQWAIQAVSHMWAKRGPSTRLADALIERAGAQGLEDLLEGLINYRYHLNAADAPLVFEIAAQGDAVAQGLIQRAGRELGELANAVIRQLDFQQEQFEVVLVGSMFNSGEPLIQPLRETVLPIAPGARFVKLAAPPVVGAVLLGMEQVGITPTREVRERLNETVHEAQRGLVPA
jgi:N-acetylglucosamine kinase-like BadF-type ATPase